MRKILLTTTIFIGILAANSHQSGFKDNKNGGFQSNIPIVTVKQAKDLADKSIVSIEGNIIKQLDDDDFIFQDDTGWIEIDIDHKLFKGQIITPEDKVRIKGKVDKEFLKRTQIDVFEIIKL